MAKMKLLPEVKSLGHLRQLCATANPTNEWYRKLAIAAANNLGGDARDHNQAISHLEIEAMETDEEGIVEEINFCRDLVNN